MMQSAESLLRQDATVGFGMSSAVRRFLPEAEMRAILMVVTDVLREQPLEMAFIEGNDVIQQVTPAALDPTLRDAVLPGTLERGADRAYTQGSNRCGDFQPILGIPVEDEKSGCRPKGKCLS